MPSSLRWNHGQNGIDRITSSDGDVSGEWYAVKAIGGTLTFGPNMSVEQNDAPAEDDTLAQGDVLSLSFTQIDIKSGTCYAFIKDAG